LVQREMNGRGAKETTQWEVVSARKAVRHKKGGAGKTKMNAVWRQKGKKKGGSQKKKRSIGPKANH